MRFGSRALRVITAWFLIFNLVSIPYYLLYIILLLLNVMLFYHVVISLGLINWMTEIPHCIEELLFFN